MLDRLQKAWGAGHKHEFARHLRLFADKLDNGGRESKRKRKK
jgi:hypothetical protein